MAKQNNAVLVGAGIAALAAATYFLTGKKGAKNRKVLKGWAVKMRGEIIEKLEDAKEVTEPVYHNIVDTVAKAYTVAGAIPRKEIMELADDLKKDWRVISRMAKGGSKSKKKAKTAKKAPAKKTGKSSAKSKGGKK